MKKKGRVLTLAMLERTGACRDGKRQFEKTFGDSVFVTEELCRLLAIASTRIRTTTWAWSFLGELPGISLRARAATDAAINRHYHNVYKPAMDKARAEANDFAEAKALEDRESYVATAWARLFIRNG